MGSEFEQVQMVLGRRIKELRASKNYSQSHMAELTGLNRAHISAIENGHQNISLDSLIKIALCLDARLSELFEVPNSMTDKMRDSKFVKALFLPKDTFSTWGKLATGGLLAGLSFAAPISATGVEILREYFKNQSNKED